MRLLDSKTTLQTLALALLAASVLTFAQPCSAATPNVIGYQGRVLVGGVPFAGPNGNFRFALVDGNTIVWNSTVGASSAAPTADISIPVSNGLYSVLIGNTANGNPIMAALPATIFTNNNPLALRVYFSDTGPASQALAPDQTIAAVGYAVMAKGVDDASITAAKIVDGAVTANKIADASITSQKISLFPKVNVIWNTQNFPNSTSTAITFQQANIDTDSMYNGNTPNIITVNTAGVYILSACMRFTTNGSGMRELSFVVNGTIGLANSAGTTITGGNQYGVQRAVPTASPDPYFVNITTIVNLSVGDKVSLVAFQTSGTNLGSQPGTASYANFSACKLP